MIKEIERLNREIERLMTEKTKADAQKEVWNTRLTESIQAYKAAYGVDLSGKDLVDITNKLNEERNIVETKTKEEFEKSAKIVNLINSGDIKGAWDLIGTDSSDNSNLGVSSNNTTEVPKETNAPVMQGAIEAVEELEDDDFYGSEEDEEVIQQTPVQSTPIVNNINREENTKKAEPVKETKQFNPLNFTAIDDDEDDDEFIVPSTSNNTITMDDEDDGDDFGGFGSILEGTKFKV